MTPECEERFFKGLSAIGNNILKSWAEIRKIKKNPQETDLEFFEKVFEDWKQNYDCEE